MFLLVGCAGGDLTGADAFDPIKPANRAVHQINKGVDTVVLKPASAIYAAVTPDPVEDLVMNAASNLGTPADAVNHLLQGDFAAAFAMAGRFGLNSTIGLLGLFDPATGLGIPANDTDFGETLYTWGVDEGAYVELPLMGPSTARDATGRIVDFFIDPVNTVIKAPESDYVLAFRVLEIIDQRNRFAVFVEPVLYDSEDSYLAARSAYLQNRRGALKGETDASDLEDPFAFE